MNNHLKKFLRDCKNIRLRDDDRTTLRAHLAQMTGATEAAQEPRIAWIQQLRTMMSPQYAYALMAVLLAVVTGGGVAFAAEKAVPGDVLYPIKNATEEVRGTLARTPQEKVVWEGKLLERRLHEAEKIITKKTTPARLASIQTNIAVHARRAQKSIDALERSGDVKAAAQASSDIEVPLQAHKKIIRILGERSLDKRDATSRLLKTVEDEERSVRMRRQDLETTIDYKTAPSGTITNDQFKEKTETKQTFRTRERARRVINEEKILLKAKKDLDVSASVDDHAEDENVLDEILSPLRNQRR